MRLRGYERRLIVEIPHGEARGVDAAVVCVSLALLAMSLAWRVFWPVLNPASWAPVAVALALLAGGVLVAATQPPGTGIAPRRSS